jgi:hypothetical protein
MGKLFRPINVSILLIVFSINRNNDEMLVQINGLID